MANIVTTTITLNDSTLGLKSTKTSTRSSTGTNVDIRVLEIGTSEEEITISADVGNACEVYIENLDGTNYCEVGIATGVYPIKLLAGQVNLFSIAPATASIFMKANTDAVNIKFYVHEV